MKQIVTILVLVTVCYVLYQAADRKSRKRAFKDARFHLVRLGATLLIVAFLLFGALHFSSTKLF